MCVSETDLADGDLCRLAIAEILGRNIFCFCGEDNAIEALERFRFLRTRVLNKQPCYIYRVDRKLPFLNKMLCYQLQVRRYEHHHHNS